MHSFNSKIEQDIPKKVGLLGNNLNLMPQTGKKEYLVAIKYLNEADTMYKRIDYSTVIEFLSKDKQGNYLFSVTNTNFYVDKKKMDSVIEEITESISSIIYPIELLIESNGTIKEIVNNEAIENRWLEKLVALKQAYKGNIVDNMLRQVNQNIFDTIKLEQSLYKNIAMSLLFNNKYGVYNADMSRESHILFPADAAIGGLVYEGDNVIKEHINAYDAIELNFKGTAKFPLKSTISKPYGDKLYSKLDVLYDLDVITRMPTLIQANCKIFTEAHKKIKTIQALITTSV